MEDGERTYIDDPAGNADGLRRWVVSDYKFEGKCERCKTNTEVWKYYSFMDGTYLDLCLLDIRDYDNTFSNHSKIGKIYTRNPLAPVKRPTRKRIWVLHNFECRTCQEIVSIEGVSSPNQEGSYVFRGICTGCNSEVKGLTSDLSERSKELKAKREEENRRRRQDETATLRETYQPITFQNVVERKDIAEELLDLIREKTSINAGPKAETTNKRRLKLFCVTCQQERSFIDNDQEDQDEKHFVGSCAYCNSEVAGDLEKLKAESATAFAEFKKREEAAYVARNLQFAKELWESRFGHLNKGKHRDD